MKTPKQKMVRPFNQKKDNANRRLNFLTGLIVAMTAVLFAFNWKTPIIDPTVHPPLVLDPIEEDFIQVAVVEKKEKQPEPEVDKNKPKSENPVSEKVITKTISNTMVIRKNTEDNIDFSAIELPEFLPEENISNEPFTIVEDMPIFRGCEHITDDDARQICTQKKIFEYMNKNQIYPDIAIEAGLQGTVYVGFVIGEDGKVGNVEVLKGVAGASVLNKEAERLVKSFPDFIPGEQRGRKVRVKINIPINFKLL